MPAPDDTTRNGGLPILDIPPKIREFYNTLRDRLMLAKGESREPPRLISLTSCYRGEGVSTVASNLAVTLSHHGRVLLVDANLHHPSLHRIFKVELTPGLAETLESGQVAITVAGHNFDVLAAGQMNGSLPRMVESPERLADVLKEYKEQYRFVIFDSPAVNESSAAVRLASLVDAVILVVEAERTRRETVLRVKEQLQQVEAKILGVVLNKRRFPIPGILYRK